MLLFRTSAGSRSSSTSPCSSACRSRDGPISSRSARSRTSGEIGCPGDRSVSQILVSGAAVEFGSTTVFENVTFTIAPRDRWGIVGRNGTGKTTLFKLLTGDLAPTRGSIARQPGLRLALLEQHRDFGSATTVWEAAALPFAGLFEL